MSSSSLFDIAFPDAVHIIDNRVKLRVGLELDESTLQEKSSNAVAQQIEGAKQLQQCVAQLLLSAASAACVIQPTPMNTAPLREIHVMVVAGSDEFAASEQQQQHMCVSVNFAAWMSFAPSLLPDDKSDLLGRLGRTADFLVNVAAAPSLFDVMLRVFAHSNSETTTTTGAPVFSPARIVDSGFLSAPRSLHLESAVQNQRGAFSGGFRLVTVLLFLVFSRTCTVQQLFLYFAQQRESLQKEATATMLDLQRGLGEQNAGVSTQSQSQSSQKRVPNQQQQPLLTQTDLAQRDGFLGEDLLATQTQTTRSHDAYRRTRSGGDAAAENDDADADTGGVESLESFGSSFGRSAFEFGLRRRSAALLIWSTLRRAVPSSQWILDLCQATSVSSDLFNLFLIGSAVNQHSEIGSSKKSLSSLENVWLAQCAGMNRAAFLVSPEQEEGEEEGSNHLLFGSSSRLWWRRQQQACARLSIDMERRDNSEGTSSSSVSPLLRGLTVRIDCCCCDLAPSRTPRQKQQQQQEDGGGVEDALGALRTEVDAHLVRCNVGRSSSARSNNERQFAFAQSLAQHTRGFSFPVLLLHFALISPSTSASATTTNSRELKQRFVVCVYGAIGCCSGDSPLTFSEETATIVSARRLQQQGGLLRVYDFTTESCGASRAMEFASVCQELGSVPFSGFVHAVLDPSCTAPRCSFHLLDSGAFVHHRTSAMRFFTSELKRQQRQQQLDLLSSLILWNMELSSPLASAAAEAVSTASAMAATASFHLFCEQVVHGDPSWVQRFLPPPVASSSSGNRDWSVRFDEWGRERVAFVMRRAIAHHTRKSFLVKILPNGSKNKNQNQQPQNQQPQREDLLEMGRDGNFSTLHQASVLFESDQQKDDEENGLLLGELTTQRDNAATAMMLFAAAGRGGEDDGDDLAGLEQQQQQQQHAVMAQQDLVLQTTQQSPASTPSIAILKKWLKVLSS